MAYVGIDFGNSRCIVSATLENGKYPRVVTNSYGSESTPSLVSFSHGKRTVGIRAQRELRGTGSDYVANNIQRLLVPPKKMFDKEKQIMIGNRKFNYREEFISFRLYGNEQRRLVEELPIDVALISLFSNLVRSVQSAYPGIPIKKCVISIPDFYNEIQIERLLLIASIATKDVNLNITGSSRNSPFVSALKNSRAAAFFHIKDRISEFANLKNPIYVVIIDMGEASTSASILEILSPERYQILSSRCDPFLGGRNVDLLLYDYVQKYLKKSQNEVQSPQKIHSLLHQCEMTKIRDISFSTSQSDKFSINLDTVLPGDHLPVEIEAGKFNRKVLSLTKRLSEICLHVLEDCERERDRCEMHSVEMIGKGSILPTFKNIVQNIFKIRPRTASDAYISRGCSLYGFLNPQRSHPKGQNTEHEHTLLRYEEFYKDRELKIQEFDLLKHEFDAEIRSRLKKHRPDEDVYLFLVNAIQELKLKSFDRNGIRGLQDDKTYFQIEYGNITSKSSPERTADDRKKTVAETGTTPSELEASKHNSTQGLDTDSCRAIKEDEIRGNEEEKNIAEERDKTNYPLQMSEESEVTLNTNPRNSKNGNDSESRDLGKDSNVQTVIGETEDFQNQVQGNDAMDICDEDEDNSKHSSIYFKELLRKDEEEDRKKCDSRNILREIRHRLADGIEVVEKALHDLDINSHYALHEPEKVDLEKDLLQKKRNWCDKSIKYHRIWTEEHGSDEVEITSLIEEREKILEEIDKLKMSLNQSLQRSFS